MKILPVRKKIICMKIFIRHFFQKISRETTYWCSQI